MKLIYRALAILGFVGMTLAFTEPASAQQACLTRDAATKQLQKQLKKVYLQKKQKS